MSEDEARQWVKDQFDVSRETWDRLETYVSLLIEESADQNLIAASTLESVWQRHIVDSAQLLKLLPDDSRTGRWLDLGSGPGLPGLVVAILSNWEVTLLESRRGRIQFLTRCVQELDLPNARVAGCQLAAYNPDGPSDVISARAFAPMPRLLEGAARLADLNTLWLLPKGRNAQSELDMIRASWQGEFQMKQSLTSDESKIIVARSVSQRLPGRLPRKEKTA